jgi:hypothetical protein
VADLPKPAREVASESISGAHGVADRLGPAAGQLVAGANDTFVAAMHYAAWGSAITALLGVLVVLVWLPRRSGTPGPVPQPAETPALRPAETPDVQLELAGAQR